MIISIVTVLILALISLLAYDDYKKHSIDKKHEALLWILVSAALYLQQDIGSFYLLTMSFGLIYLCNEFIFSKFNKKIAAQGDVMVIPPMLAFIEMQGVIMPFAWITVICLFCSSGYYYFKYGKEAVGMKTPLLAFLWFPLILALVYGLFAEMNMAA
jgi:hypothetical protein